MGAWAVEGGIETALDPGHPPGVEVIGYAAESEGQWNLLLDLGWPSTLARLSWGGDGRRPAQVDPNVHVIRFLLLSETPGRGCYRRFASRRTRYEPPTYVVQLIDDRPTTWPGAWLRPDQPPAAGGSGAETFTGELRTGGEFSTALIWRPDPASRGGNWVIAGLDEPRNMAGRTVEWTNPELLPAIVPDVGDLRVRFRIVERDHHLIAGAMLPELCGGGMFLDFPSWKAVITAVGTADE